ncbi:MAG: hypothetical protein WBE01_09895, partial [Methyloceanibacter sp.]
MAAATPVAPEAVAKAAPSTLRSSRTIWIAALAAAALVIAGGVLFGLYGPRDADPGGGGGASTEKLSFVGSESCAGCHQAEAGLWQGSQHKHAMAHATDATVLGDFN